MKVSKFGGTSLATAEQIRKVFNIVTADSDRRIIVVSAPGKRFKDDIKVTDLLINFAEQYLKFGKADKELNAVIERYKEIAQGLQLSKDIISHIIDEIRKALLSDVSNETVFMDKVKSCGEDSSAKLVSYYLQSKGIDSKYINPKDVGLLVSNEYGNAQVLPESYENLRKLKEMSGVLIFPGFFGFSPEGTLVTFPRGGSDITGAILAAAVKADVYENFTDVDSVFAVNPNLISNPKEIKELTFREMRELSYSGFSVFNEEALIPAFRAGIPVNIKNTNNPEAPGTMIVFNREASISPIAGIASDSGFCTIYVGKYLMNREIGFGRKLLKILEDEGLSYEHTPSGIDSISVILRENQLNKEVESRVSQRIRTELEVDDIIVERDLALIMIVGEGMRRTIGLASRVTNALFKSEVNIEMINQGSSEFSMMFGVRAIDEKKAVISLYEEFFVKTLSKV